MWRDFKFFFADKQTDDRLTDKLDCLTPLRACADGVMTSKTASTCTEDKLAAIKRLCIMETIILLETKNFLTKITNDLVMATPIDSRKSRQTRNANNQAQSHPIEKCRI